jgi:hypothetical protein
LYSTDLRVEFIGDVNEKTIELSSDAWYNQTRYLLVFTHEWKINSEIQAKQKNPINML